MKKVELHKVVQNIKIGVNGNGIDRKNIGKNQAI